MDKKFLKANGKLLKLQNMKLWRVDIEDDHFYWSDDYGYVPSVTQVLDAGMPTPFGLKLFYQIKTKEEADKVLEDTGNFGKLMHDAYEKLLLGLPLNLERDYPRDDMKHSILSFMDWFQTWQPTEFETEQSLAYVSEEYALAGTLDLVCMINGERWLIDFKTTTGIRQKHELQVIAYKHAYEQSYGVEIDRVGVLRLGTTHKGRKKKNDDLQMTGRGWEFKEVTNYTMEDYDIVYRMFLLVNNGKIPEPKLKVKYPVEVRLFKESDQDNVNKEEK